MKTFFTFVTAALVWSLCAHNTALAQDTVKYRLVTSYLEDSSLIRYELGCVGHITSGTIKYLVFADTAPTSIATVWQSKNFTVATTHDSIMLCRFASIDNQHEIIDTIGGTTIDTAKLDTFISACKRRYLDTNFYVVPAPSAFNSFSSFLYVVQIRNASDNSLLLNLDSTACFLDDTGHLIWACSADKRVRSFSISSIAPGTSVFLTVARTAILPAGASILGDEFTIEATNPPPIYGDSGWLGQEVHWSSVPALKPTSISTPERELSILEYSDAKNIKLSLSLPVGTIRVTLSDASGRILKNIERELPGGDYELPIDCGNLADGCYFITVEGAAINPLRARFIIPSPISPSPILASIGVRLDGLAHGAASAIRAISTNLSFFKNGAKEPTDMIGPIFGRIKGYLYQYGDGLSDEPGFEYLPCEPQTGSGNLTGGTVIGVMYEQYADSFTAGGNYPTGHQNCSLFDGQ